MKKHIPNCITLMNLVCGSVACILALNGIYMSALVFILLAACFDFCDGFSARLLHAYSDIGKELDSLCDLVSFGLAPSLMMFHWYWNGGHEFPYLALAALLVAAFSALRLAKFNVDPRQSIDFIGLPTPACAMIAAPAVAFASISSRSSEECFFLSLMDSVWFIPLLSALLAFLLVCELPMFSMKKKRLSFRENPFLMIFLVAALLIVAAGAVISLQSWPVWLLLIFTLYVILNSVRLIF